MNQKLAVKFARIRIVVEVGIVTIRPHHISAFRESAVCGSVASRLVSAAKRDFCHRDRVATRDLRSCMGYQREYSG